MRTYLKAFLFLALTASIVCAGANFAQAAETAPAASAGNGMMPPVGTFDNNAAYQALTPEKQAKYNEIVKSAEEAMLPLREKMMAKRLQLDTMASMPNMNEEAIAKAAAEVASLHTQMIKVHDMMADRLANELGISIQRGTCSDALPHASRHDARLPSSGHDDAHVLIGNGAFEGRERGPFKKGPLSLPTSPLLSPS